MDLGLGGRVALVAGASKGLGFATAKKLAEEGADVAINSRSRDALNAAAEEIRQATGRRVLAIPGDLTAESLAEDVVAEAIREMGRVDILVPNAGGPPPGGVDDFDAEDYRRAIELSFMTTVRLVLAALPGMRSRGWGRVVAIASVSVKQPIGGLLLSNVARPGVVGFIKTISRELGADGVLCNVVAPGFIHTDRVESLLRARAKANDSSPDEELAAIASGIPLARIGRPEEFANAVAFLASEAASYITGHTLQIDGGLVQGLL